MESNQPIRLVFRDLGRRVGLTGLEPLEKKTITTEQPRHALAHFTVLQHTTAVARYIDEHKAKLRQDHPNRTNAWRTREHNKDFNKWFKERRGLGSSSDMLTWYAKGPTFKVITW